MWWTWELLSLSAVFTCSLTRGCAAEIWRTITSPFQQRPTWGPCRAYHVTCQRRWKPSQATFKSGNPRSQFRSFFGSSPGTSPSCTVRRWLQQRCVKTGHDSHVTNSQPILPHSAGWSAHIQHSRKVRSAFRPSVTTHIYTNVSTFRDWLRQTGISHGLRVGMLHCLARRLSVWSSFVFHSAKLCATGHPYCLSFSQALCNTTPVRGEFRPRQTRQLPRAVDLKGRFLSCQSY